MDGSLVFSSFSLVFFLLLSPFTFAQQELKVTNSATYETSIDKELTVKSITVLPVSDNANGIYARPVEEELKDLVNKDTRFQYVNSQFAGTLESLDDLETNPQQVKDISQGINADALIGCRIIKGPDGMVTHLSLFLKSDGMLVSQQVFKDKPTADIKTLKNSAADLYAKMVKQIPYDGVVLSRNGSMVTINLGRKNGLSSGQTVNAVLLLNANRHPKFHFLISTEKEILGKIRLQKVDDTLSFGQIISEKDPGAIQKNAKISGIDFVQYVDSSTDSLAGYKPQSQNDNLEKKITFGENPKEWKPSAPPSFGKVGAQLGLGQMTYNTTLKSAGSLTASDSIYPFVKLYTELWFTPQWIFNFEMNQGILTLSNPLSGSSPSKLSASQSTYLLSLGYNFMIQDDFFGPSILVALGFADYELNADSSTPLSLTATHYTGMFLNVRGTMPITADRKWNMGAALKYFLKSDLSESPQDSGSNSNTITQFSLLGFYQKNTRLRYTATLDFSLFSTNFSGGGSRSDNATNASQKYTNLSAGIEYLF